MLFALTLFSWRVLFRSERRYVTVRLAPLDTLYLDALTCHNIFHELLSAHMLCFLIFLVENVTVSHTVDGHGFNFSRKSCIEVCRWICDCLDR